MLEDQILNQTAEEAQDDNHTKDDSKSGLFYTIKKDFFSIPISIRIISFSTFLFVLGWGLGADTFFSIFVKNIVDNILLVSIIAGLMPLSRMLFSIPIGSLDDHADMKSVILMSKILYAIAGFLYFFAGIFGSVTILVFAVIINGFASAALFTTYETYIRLVAKKKNRFTVFGLYFSSINLAYVIGALISAVLVGFIHLPYMYLFIVLFSLISVFTDNTLPQLRKKKLKNIFGKESFFHQFFREAFSFGQIKKVFASVKLYSKGLNYALGLEVLFNILNYIGFIFIPIVALKENLSLSEIAIIFGIMRLPYLTNFFVGEVANKYNKKNMITVILLFLAFLFALLGISEGFTSIMVISFGIALGLALLRPIISGLVSEFVNPKDIGTISGVQGFSAMLGDITGVIGFGIISSFIGVENTFVLIGIGLFSIGGYFAFQKIKSMYVKN